MVNIMLYHGRDVFRGPDFKPALKKTFPSVKFEGFLNGNWYPSISVPYDEFRDNYKNLPESIAVKIAEIKCSPTILEALVYAVKGIHRVTNLHPYFDDYSGGRIPYGEKVEEIITIL